MRMRFFIYGIGEYRKRQVLTQYFPPRRYSNLWLLRAAAGAPEQMKIMYGSDGGRRLTEVEMPWLAGYEGSRQVRIGNGAYEQVQVDVFGELVDAFHAAQIGRAHV